MERHKCKLCTRAFANGRALGGHMKAHLATLPLPPKTTTIHQQQQLQLGTESTSSSSYSFSGEEQEQEEEIEKLEVEGKGLIYGLRENPKKSFRLADPEFSFAVVDAASVIVQDRESETESRNPTRRRSERTRKSSFLDDQKRNFDVKKVKLKNPSSAAESPPPPLPPQPVELEPVSSVSNTSPEEDVAMCLMMLSRDIWMRNNDEEQDKDHDIKYKDGSINQITLKNKKKVETIKAQKLRCEKCKKLFRSYQALVSHKKICSLNSKGLRNENGNGRIFECPFCFKIFGSGQALGGHKRSHLVSSSTISSAAASSAMENSSENVNNLIDLNLPAPLDDDDEFSVVSDA